MTKLQVPGTIESSLWRVSEIIGLDEMALICGKTENMMSKYRSLEEENNHIHAKFIYDLDRACKEESGETPITSMIIRRLNKVKGNTAVCPMDALTDATVSLGKLIQSVKAAKAPTGPAGTRINHNELCKVKAGIDYMRRELDKVEEAVEYGAHPQIKAVG